MDLCTAILMNTCKTAKLTPPQALVDVCVVYSTCTQGRCERVSNDHELTEVCMSCLPC